MFYCKNGRSLAEALFLVCEDRKTGLGNLFFGSIRPSFNDETDEIKVSDHGRMLQLIPGTSGELTLTGSLYTGNIVILHTDFRSFTFWRTDSKGEVTRPFANFNVSDMYDEIAFTGSIWASVYPSHYGIVSRTISYAFAQTANSALFSTDLGPAADLLHEERAALDRLWCFASVFTNLLSLEALRVEMQSYARPPKLLSEHREGAYTLRQYSPQRSSLFDFGEPAGELSCSDFVTTYNAGEEEFHREFFIAPRRWENHEAELRLAAFDILHLLAIRRSKLFRIGFANCVYNILLPPVVMKDGSGSTNSYAIFPCLSLYRISKKGDFQRTLSITFIVCPVELSVDHGNWTDIFSRPAPLEELHRLKDDLLSPVADLATLKVTRRYTTGGPIKSYLSIPNECTVPELLHCISKIILERILAGSQSDDVSLDRLVSSTLFTSNLEFRMATMVLQVEWAPPEGFTKPWERWLATGQDKVFSNSLFRTMYYWDYLDQHSADASRRAVRFEEFNIGDAAGADMSGMTLYNPQEYLKIVLYPRDCESYPNHSLMRWMTWQVYIDSALTSLRALIYKFHPILTERADLHSVIGTLEEMVKEFVHFYYLDIRDFIYRKEYERLRTLTQVDMDYVQLLSKFESSKEEASLREQRLINKLIVALTLATVTLTVLSTLAEIGALGKFDYLVLALGLSLIVVLIGYILFDPVRRVFRRFHYAISRLRR